MEAHKNQRYGDRAYSTHLYDVATLTMQVQDPVLNRDFLNIVSWLHDILEDTGVTADDLLDKFGPLVAATVEIITDPSDAPNRRQKKAIMNNRLRLVDVSTIIGRCALIVKAADRLANIRFSELSQNEGKLKMYRKEHDAFQESVWRPDICPHLWDPMKRGLGLI